MSTFYLKGTVIQLFMIKLLHNAWLYFYQQYTTFNYSIIGYDIYKQIVADSVLVEYEIPNQILNHESIINYISYQNLFSNQS